MSRRTKLPTKQPSGSHRACTGCHGACAGSRRRRESGTAKADAAAAPAAAPAAPTTPQLIAADKINSGDTAWMLSSVALVLLMTIPGLALFYGGMVRKKNVLATLMQSFAITCLVTMLWVIAGYSLAFMPGGSFIGSLDRLFLNGMLFQKDAAKLTVLASRGDDSRVGVRHVPGDVCDHHSRADRRRVCRTR